MSALTPRLPRTSSLSRLTDIPSSRAASTCVNPNSAPQPGGPDHGGAQVDRPPPHRQQPPQHCLPAQGVPSPSSAPTPRRMPSTLLRKLARRAQVAKAQALRAVPRDDRASLGGHRAPLCRREQGSPPSRPRAQQQGPPHPASAVRPTQRPLPAPPGPLLHPAQAITPTSHGSF